MKTAILLAALTLVACGPPADVVSSRGTVFYLNGLTDTGLDRASVDKAQLQMVLDLRKYGFMAADVEAAMGIATVDVKDVAWTCLSDHSEQCSGEQYSEHLYIENPRGCVGWSTLGHETIHLLHQRLGYPSDYGHIRPEWDEAIGRLAFTRSHACDGSLND